MAKSIRISDELYGLASREAALMDRSLAEQVEHWVKLGVGLEHSEDASVHAVRSAAIRYRKLCNEVAVRSGRKPPENLYLLSSAALRNARLEFPKAAFATRRKGW